MNSLFVNLSKLKYLYILLLTIYDYARAQDGLIKKTSALHQNKHLEDAFKSGLEETDTVNYFLWGDAL